MGDFVHVPLKSYKSLQLGYALTTHKGQGTTVDNAYLLVGGKMQDRELSYVQASRARISTRIYTDRHEAGKELAGLVKQMTKSREKILAHEVVARQDQQREALRLREEIKL
jgi:ATP-dependent exoDNAse (exonuclease V) alpha subunit